MSIIIGIVGENGGGKDSLSKAIATCRPDLVVETFKSSDILRDTLKMWGIETTREHLQQLPVLMDRTFGEGVLSRAVHARMQASMAHVIIFNGVRWATDVSVVRSFERNMLVYITAEPELRFGRLTARFEKPGEHGMNYTQFQQEEQALTERMIPEIGKTADYTIHNNGSMDSFMGDVKKFCDTFLQDIK